MTREPTVGLAEAIGALREQLTSAMRAGWNEGMGFTVKPIELTLQVTVDKDADGRIGWGVLGIGAAYKAAATQTLKLTMVPVWRTPGQPATDDFTVASEVTGDVVFGSAMAVGADREEHGGIS